MNWVYFEIDKSAFQWIGAAHSHLVMAEYQMWADSQYYADIIDRLVRQFGSCVETWNGDMILDIDPLEGSVGRFVATRALHHPPVFQCRHIRPFEFLFPTKEQALLAKLILS